MPPDFHTGRIAMRSPFSKPSPNTVNPHSETVGRPNTILHSFLHDTKGIFRYK